MTRSADGGAARAAVRPTHLDPGITRQLSLRIKGALHDKPRTTLLDPEATRKLTERFKDTLALGADEQAALATLPADQRKQYEAVAAGLDPAARAALRRMLEEGKLPGAKDLLGGGTLLDNLATLATQPPGPGIDRKDVLSQAVRAVADPGNITQGNALTCGAATTQIMLARKNPAEYARILAGLSGAEGKVQLAGGNTITRQANWDRSDIPGGANQLMQTSFMSYAAGGYDAASDTRLDSPAGTDATKTGESQPTTHGKKGLYNGEVAFLQEGVLGQAVTELEGNSDDVMKKISAQANAGKPVSVLVEGQGGGHYVQVTKVEGGKLTYVDPRDGKEHTVEAAEFQKSVRAANVDAPKGQKLRKERPTDHKGILGGGCFLVEAFKAIGKAIVAAVQAIGKAIVAIGKAIVSAFKAIGKAIVTVVKAVVNLVVEVVKKVWNVVKEIAKAVWEVVKTVAKAIGEFWKKFGGFILMAVQIVCLFIPGAQAISLGIAAIQFAQGAVAVGKGIATGNWKEAVGGVIGMVASFAGGVGALGAKIVGTGLATAANVAGRVAQAAGGVMATAEGIRTGNWGGAIAGIAGAVAGGAGAVAAGAGKVADTVSQWADKVNSFAAKGNNLYQGIKNGDVVGAIAAGTGVAAAGTGMVTDHKLANGIAGGLNTAAGAVNTGKKVVESVGKGGAIALGAAAGAAALGGGIGLLAMGSEGRKNLFDAMGKAGDDWSKGNYGQAGRDIARGLGADPNGGLGKFLGGAARFVGGAVDGAQAFFGARDLAEKASGAAPVDANDVAKNNRLLRSGVHNSLAAFGLDSGLPEAGQ